MSSADVDAWLVDTKNPNKDVIVAVREIVMTDDRVAEAVKYRAPAFLHDGIMAYFNWSAKKFASLIFPKGSEIPGEFDLLEGDGLQRMIRFVDVESVEAAKEELLDIVDLWCSHRVS